MTTEGRVTVHVSRHFAASAERVFDAWLDPQKIGKFLFATKTGQVVRVEVDARVGGHFVVVDRRDGEDIEHVGTYVELDRPRRLVFDFTVPKFSAEATRVALDIVPDGEECEVTLTHENVFLDYAERTKGGWTGILDGLATTLDAPPELYGWVSAPGSIRFERLAPGPIERVWSYLTDSDKRGTWLAKGEMELTVGAPVTLRFHHASLSSEFAPPPEHFKPFENGHNSQHRITRVEPPRLLAFTWGSGAGGPSEVIFELTPEGDQVRLALTHRNLGDRTAGVDVATGWHVHLGMLVDRLNGREPPAFWSSIATIGGEYDARLP